MQTLLTTAFPYIVTAVSWVVLILGAIMTTFIMAFFAYFWYNKMLREVSWKGWYYSMCLLISDMARGKAAWHPAHVGKVCSLLMGLRDENPAMFFDIMRELDKARQQKPREMAEAPVAKPVKPNAPSGPRASFGQ